MKRGSNLPAVGTYNQTLVLDLIRRAPRGLSRVELADRTGLSAQTLSNVARRLTEGGLIIEGAKVRSGPGKPRTMLALNPRARYAVGVHLDPAIDTFVVVDLAGTVVAHAEHPPRSSGSTTELIEGVADAIADLVARAEVPRESLLGIGVAAPGPLDGETGTLLNPPLLPAWHGVALRDELATATGLPVELEKDVTAAMVGEMWVDTDDDLRDAMFLYYGAGVGLGLAVDGAVVRGRTGNAGNIAHLQVDPQGLRCECGHRGCLGQSIEPGHLLRSAGMRASTDDELHLPDARLELDALLRRDDEGDAAASATLTHTAGLIAHAIVALNNLLDVDVAVIGGPVWTRLSRGLLERVRLAVATDASATTTRTTQIFETRLGTDVAALGAACLVLDGAFTARPADMMITP